MTRLPRENLAPSFFSVITSYTRSFLKGLEAEVPGVQSEGLPTGKLREDPGYPGQHVTPPGRRVPECGHRSGIADRLRPHLSTQVVSPHVRPGNSQARRSVPEGLAFISDPAGRRPGRAIGWAGT